MLALQRAGDSLQARLLPAAVGFPILENLIPANQPRIVEFERLTLGCGPEHEGRVAERSPGDRNGAFRRLVFNQPMLRENRRGISFGEFARDHPDHSIVVMQKRRFRRRNKLRIVYRLVRKPLWPCRNGPQQIEGANQNQRGKKLHSCPPRKNIMPVVSCQEYLFLPRLTRLSVFLHCPMNHNLREWLRATLPASSVIGRQRRLYDYAVE